MTFVRAVVDWAVCFQRGQGMNFIDDSSSQALRRDTRIVTVGVAENVLQKSL